MSEFICNKCHKVFKKKYNYNQHQKRKTSCIKNKIIDSIDVNNKNDVNNDNNNTIDSIDVNNKNDVNNDNKINDINDVIDNNNYINELINNVKLNLIDKNEVYLYIRQLLW